MDTTVGLPLQAGGVEDDGYLYGNISSSFPPQVAPVNSSSSPSGLSPEELYYNIGYRFRLIMSQPHQIIALLLGFIAISSNILSIMALRHCKWTMGCYFKLLMSLSISDVLIGCSLVLHKLSKVFNPAYRVGQGPPAARLRSRCIFMVIKALNNTALNSTLLNLMVMALDHYVAIIRPLHYHTLLSDTRRHLLIGALWLVAIILGFSDFLTPLGMQQKYIGASPLNYCEMMWTSPYHEEFCTFGLTAICLCVMSYIYIRIYIVVRKQQRREQLHSQDLRKNKKALYTTLLVLGFFILCWLPNCLFQVILFIQVQINPDKLSTMSETVYNVGQYLTGLLFVNAIGDPIIYVSRMREIRQGYVSIFYRCCKRYAKYPRRHSESVTLDYTLSHHRKSSTAISNGSAKHDKFNPATQSTGIGKSKSADRTDLQQRETQETNQTPLTNNSHTARNLQDPERRGQCTNRQPDSNSHTQPVREETALLSEGMERSGVNNNTGSGVNNTGSRSTRDTETGSSNGYQSGLQGSGVRGEVEECEGESLLTTITAHQATQDPTHTSGVSV